MACVRHPLAVRLPERAAVLAMTGTSAASAGMGAWRAGAVGWLG